MDTTLPGNSNAGHSFEDGPRGNGVIGPLLTDEQRWALVEYLKSIPEEPAELRHSEVRQSRAQETASSRDARARNLDQGQWKLAMADHIDGPRSIGDPSIDLTDLFAFTSPENAGRTVIAADVFPSAGASAMFSNVVNHAIVVRRVTVAGLGEAAAFKIG